MSKIFISALGVGSYTSSIYFQGEEFESKETPYAQIATMQLWNCNEWSKAKSDKIVILLTKKAEEIFYKGLVKDNKVIPSLKTEILNLGIDEDIITPIHIEDGKNKQEIMDIFTKINAEVEGLESVSLYYDLTYGLRYLPMLIVVFNNYSRFVNKTQCAHIAYGSFQTKIDGKVPIINLDWLDNIQQWSTAAENFINSGNSTGFQKLVIADSREKKVNRSALPSSLDDITNNLLTCHGTEIIEGKMFKSLFNILERTTEKDLPEPLIPIIRLMEKDMENFSREKNWKNGVIAAKWCYDHHLYQQALTLIQEIGITYICMALRLNYTKEKDRDIVGSIRYYLFQKKDNGKEYTRPTFFNAKEQSYLSTIQKNECLMAWMKIINDGIDPRNKYNHGGMKGANGKASRMISNIGALISDALSIQYPENLNVVDSGSFGENDKLFINISNHPSANWSDSQRNAAEQLGRIIDIDFPQVETEATDTEILKQCDNVISDVQRLTRGNTSCTIHVMGEMNLTYSLVKGLTRIGYTCVASTTKRNVTDNADGTKTSKFEFIQFRRYEGKKFDA